VTSLIFTCYEQDGVTSTTTPDEIVSVQIQLVTIDSEGKASDIPLSSRAYIRDSYEGGSFSLDYAILVGGDMEISGDGAEIQGILGNIHVNGDLVISAAADIEGNVTASGSYDDHGNPNIGGDAQGGVPPVEIPAIIPSDYLYLADYVLKFDGEVLDHDGNHLADEEYNGWKWGGTEWDKWDHVDNVGFDGTYYIEGDAIVGDNPQDWIVTIVTTGSIEISGETEMDADELDILFVAGGDLKINGKPEQEFVGYMLAHEQLEISGAPVLNGAMIAEDAEDNHDFVEENKISGSLNLTYDGGLEPLPFEGGGGINILSWYYVSEW